MRFLPAAEVVRICSTRGDVLIDIIKNKSEEADFTAFMDALRIRIEDNAAR